MLPHVSNYYYILLYLSFSTGCYHKDVNRNKKNFAGRWTQVNPFENKMKISTNVYQQLPSVEEEDMANSCR